MNTRQRIITLSAAAITLGSLGFVTVAGAHGLRDPGSDGLSAKLASTFNLQTSEVQKVIDSYHSEQESTRLQQQVDAGKITAAQKTLIENKMAELKPRLDEIGAMTDQTARQEAMQKLRTEVARWEKDNNLSLPLPGGRHTGQMRHDS